MFIYGVVERSLLPFGLHHIWNVPFFFEVGSYMDPTVGSIAFTLQPTNTTVPSGVKATFAATATGTSAMLTWALPLPIMP